MRLRLFITSVCLFFVASAAVYSQVTDRQKDSLMNNVVTLPGSNISIIPPAYFKTFVKDEKFGFIHEGAASSITIQEIKGTAFSLVVQGITQPYLESQGVKYIGREDVKTTHGKDGTIFTVGFKVKSTDGTQELDYERMMFFTGDYNRTIWINANYPVVARDMLYNVLKFSLLTVQF